MSQFRDGFIVGAFAAVYTMAVVPGIVRQLRDSLNARRPKPAPRQYAPIWANTWLHPRGHVVRLYVSLDAFEHDVRELVLARRDARGGTE